MFKRKKNSQATKRRHLITQLNPRSPISEQYRSIRTNIQYASIDKDIRSILITSAGPGAGKSITAANLAVVYAQQEKNILLIDADLRKPTVHYTFRLDNLRGLSTVLINEHTLEEAVQKTSIPHLDVLTCGPIPPNPAELLASSRMERLMEETKANYDFIIVDTPPALIVTDAQVLANVVDGSIIVVRSGVAEKEDIEQAYEVIRHGKSRLLGSVLNDVPKREDAYYQYYGS